MSRTPNSKRLIEEMIRYYEARALWHDHYMGYESHEAMEELLGQVVTTIAPLIVDRSVLEIACGTGNWTQVLAKRARQVTALDSSRTALEIARRKLMPYENVILIQGDAYALEEVEGSFEVLFASDWWSHIPIGVIHQFLKSAIGKLTRDSSVIFLDMSFRDYFKNEVSTTDADGNLVFRRKLTDGSEYDVVKNFPTRKELEQLLAPFASEVEYFDFKSLQRWMVVFQPS